MRERLKKAWNEAFVEWKMKVEEFLCKLRR